MTANPTSAVTFLFTDIENSTNLAGGHPGSWEAEQARQPALLCEAIEGVFQARFIRRKVSPWL